MLEPIIFTHYGWSDYLSRTLRCASITNADKPRILIGDADNRSVALRYGWEHVEAAAINSDLRAEFSRVFRPIRGKKHPLVINKGYYLKYVFERWFITQRFCQERNIGRFWHFDSDVMMLEPLAQFEAGLCAQGLDYTRQCGGLCLNGYIDSKLLADYCRHTISLFKDEAFLEKQQEHLDANSPNFSFNEMVAFDLFSKNSHCHGKHLADSLPGWWFDDAICQSHGFGMTSSGRYGKEYNQVKNISFEEHEFCGFKDGNRLRFAVANCSWVHLGVFDWFLGNVVARAEGRTLPKSQLDDVRPSVPQRIKYGVRDLKKGVAQLIRG